MNLEVHATDDGYYQTTVTLSERNLRHLLAAFEQEPHIAGLVRRTEAGPLWVRVEADDVHYKDRDPGAGLAPFIEGLQ